MLNKIRSFSKTIFAKILLVVMIIPFVFWGMGGSFNTGNSNNIAKIDNYNISTQDFIDYLNTSQLSSEQIKEKIKDNILEQTLSDLISKTLLDMETKNLNLSVSDESLAKLIKNNKNFIDENQKFSRIKYEKFLIERNINATEFEKLLKDRELQNKLFTYVGGAIQSPFFITNKIFKEKNKKIDVGFINLNNFYKKENEFSAAEIKEFINKNQEKLKSDYIDFSYSKITPKNLTGSNEFDQNFFEKIDEIEDKILDGTEFYNLMNELKIEIISKENYNPIIDDNELEKIIFERRNDGELQIVDKNDFYLIFKINKINKVLPTLEDKLFISQIKNYLYENFKYEYNENLLKKINSKNFSDNDFINLINSKSLKVKNIQLQSINDDDKFNINSIKLLYSMPINSYTLIADNKKNIYLTKIIKFYDKDISKMSKDFNNYKNIGNIQLKDNIFSSYDYLLNNKYKIKINQKTLERVKNYYK